MISLQGVMFKREKEYSINCAKRSRLVSFGAVLGHFKEKFVEIFRTL